LTFLAGIRGDYARVHRLHEEFAAFETLPPALNLALCIAAYGLGQLEQSRQHIWRA
jgi:hypothetical protein